MAGRVLWRRRAEDDLVEVHDPLEADSPAAAERFVDAVERTVRFLLENPRVGGPRGFRSRRARGIRSWPVRTFDAYLTSTDSRAATSRWCACSTVPATSGLGSRRTAEGREPGAGAHRPAAGP